MPTPPPTEPNLRHSVLDRLLGLPDGRNVTQARIPRRLRRARSIHTFAEDVAHRSRHATGPIDWVIGAIKEDLRILLNTTRPQWCERISPTDPIYQSTLTYGMTDFSDRTPSQLRASDALRRAVQDAIARFEPRLTDVTVDVEPGLPTDYEIQLQIRAKLVRPSGVALPISLETVMSLSTRRIIVDGEGPD